MKQFEQIDASDYGMPIEDLVVASILKSALTIIEAEEAANLLSNVIAPKFTFLSVRGNGEFIQIPENGMYVNKRKLAKLINDLADLSRVFFMDALDDNPEISEKTMEGYNLVLQVLEGINGEETVEKGSDGFYAFLYDCYMAFTYVSGTD